MASIHYETNIPEARLYALLRNCRNLMYRPYVGWHTIRQLIMSTDLDEEEKLSVIWFIAAEFLRSISAQAE